MSKIDKIYEISLLSNYLQALDMAWQSASLLYENYGEKYEALKINIRSNSNEAYKMIKELENYLVDELEKTDSEDKGECEQW